MGFQKTAAVENNNVEPFARPAAVSTTGQNRKKQADAYVNISMATRDGGQAKLGAISLDADKPMEKKLLDMLTDSEEKALDALKNRLILDYKRADGNNSREFDIELAPD